VPRPRDPGRLDAIVTAALHVFGAVGYRRARMADVAAAAGVSAGLLYTYAESKEALFALVIRRESGSDLGGLDLPVPTPSPEELAAAVRDAFDLLTRHDALDAALESVGDVATELTAIVTSDLAMVSSNRELLALVERCALDWPDLASSFYDGVRRHHLARLEQYLASRTALGLLPPVDPTVGARFVMETVAWFGAHRFRDHDGAALDDGTVETEVVRLVTRALLGR